MVKHWEKQFLFFGMGVSGKKMAYCARGVGKTESHFLLTYLGKTSAVLGRGNHVCGGERWTGWAQIRQR